MAISRDDIKLQVQQSTDIVRLVGEQVALRPKGREFVGLCPFHDDSSPSMHVVPHKQIFHCFACGTGGDVFSFVMRYHKMTFPEALKHLAERAGIEIPMADGGWRMADGQSTSDRKLIAQANERAVEFFRVMLKHPEHGRIARQYLEKRGISGEMQAAFQIGASPDRWDGLVQMIESKGWDARSFELAGLITPRKRDGASGIGQDQTSDDSPDTRIPIPDTRGYYDRLRHRLIFPIADPLGRPIAFGGRKLREEDEPKYLNSPEHVLFNKSRTLYGLHLAKKPIIDAKVAVIVEGYTDVIACHQRGECNVVATLGTALTREHVAELRRFAEKVVLIFDADAAGEKAADRAVELFLTGDLDVAIAHLPEAADGGKTDPFDLMQRDDGVDVWRAAVAEAQDALDYQLHRVRERLHEAGTVTGRQRVIEDYVARVAQLGLNKAGTIRRAFVVQRLGDLLKLPESQVQQLLKEHEPRQPQRPETGDTRSEPGFASENSAQNDVARPVSGRRLRALELAERQVIGSLVRDPSLFDRPLADGRAFDEAVTGEVFVSPTAAALFRRLCDRLVEGTDVTLVRMIGDLVEAERQDLCSLLTLADSEVEQDIATDPAKLEPLWQAASVALLDYHAEVQMQKQASTSGGDALLRQRLEHSRSRSGVGRIARIQHD